MALIRRRQAWSPIREMEDMAQRFNKMLAEWPALGENGEQEQLASAEWSPSVNVSETDDTYHIDAELPGCKKDDVKVTFDKGVLTIEGKRHEEKEEKGKRFHRRELSYGSFMRRFSMPEDADAEKVDAKFEEGMLRIDIPKAEEKKKKAKSIDIK